VTKGCSFGTRGTQERFTANGKVLGHFVLSRKFGIQTTVFGKVWEVE
jgi:hypothetical protein